MVARGPGLAQKITSTSLPTHTHCMITVSLQPVIFSHETCWWKLHLSIALSHYGANNYALVQYFLLVTEYFMYISQ